MHAVECIPAGGRTPTRGLPLLVSSFPRSAWERTGATLRVADLNPGVTYPVSLGATAWDRWRDAERPKTRSHAERGNEEGKPAPGEIRMPGRPI